MAKIVNLIKAFVKKIVLLLPNGNNVLAKIILFKNKLRSVPDNTNVKAQSPNNVSAEAPTPVNANVESQTPVNDPVNPKEVFTDYYHNNYWGNKESVSGAGSTLEYTEGIRRELPRLLEQYKVQKFLDAPCGDFNWFQAMERPQGMEYIGGDIVEELVKENQAKYGDDSTRFFSINVISDSLPQTDLWMCRDCLFHFSYEDIFKTLSNFLRSDIEYLLTSVHSDCTANADIVTGGARLLHLELPPFNLCKPILYVDDWIPEFKVRRMGLWSKSMIADSLASNPEMQKYL